MKARELRQKTKEDLEELLADLKKEADELRFGAERKKLKNVKSLFGVKHNIARVLTILRESK